MITETSALNIARSIYKLREVNDEDLLEYAGMLNHAIREDLERMNNLPNLRYHICGHIHESAGKYVDYEKQRVYINASLLNEQYKLVRMPYAFIYKK